MKVTSIMADDNVNQPHEAHAALFSMSGRYLISADSTPDQLMNDTSCILNSAIAVLEGAYERLDGEMYAALYLIQQAKGMHDEAHAKLIRTSAI